MLQIRWHGHACFEITKNQTIITTSAITIVLVVLKVEWGTGIRLGRHILRYSSVCLRLKDG